MKSKDTNIAEMFQSTVENAKDIQREWNRLEKIEENVKEYMNEVDNLASGLEKSRGYQSVSYEAKKIIEEVENKNKILVDRLCLILGINKKYNLK